MYIGRYAIHGVFGIEVLLGRQEVMTPANPMPGHWTFICVVISCPPENLHTLVGVSNASCWKLW